MLLLLWKRDISDRNIPALVMLLDAKSAFDVVVREHLLRHLYCISIQGRHWSFIRSLHKEDSGVVKWLGRMSRSFPVEQGVNQVHAGIICTYFFKFI